MLFSDFMLHALYFGADKFDDFAGFLIDEDPLRPAAQTKIQDKKAAAETVSLFF